MFTLFLTSSPCDGIDGNVFEKNSFREELLRQVPQQARGVFITASPDDFDSSEWDSQSMRRALEEAGLTFSEWSLLDSRNAYAAHDIINNVDFIVLGGGHVPTQKRFFQNIFLRQELMGYDGVLLTISAGSMNCADTVYSIPELPGEAMDKEYVRFFPGLGLTTVQILPHCYSWFDRTLDGLKAYDTIAAGDSKNRRFYVFPDGTYLFSKYGYEEIRGEFYIIENGVFRQVGEDGQKILLPFI